MLVPVRSKITAIICLSPQKVTTTIFSWHDMFLKLFSVPAEPYPRSWSSKTISLAFKRMTHCFVDRYWSETLGVEAYCIPYDYWNKSLPRRQKKTRAGVCRNPVFLLLFHQCLVGSMLKAAKFHTTGLALYVIPWFRVVIGFPLLPNCYSWSARSLLSAFVYSQLFCLKGYGPIFITRSMIRAWYRCDGHSVIYFLGSNVMRTACQTSPCICFTTISFINNAGPLFMSHMRETITVVTRHLCRRNIQDMFYSPKFLVISWDWWSKDLYCFYYLVKQGCKLCTTVHNVGNGW